MKLWEDRYFVILLLIPGFLGYRVQHPFAALLGSKEKRTIRADRYIGKEITCLGTLVADILKVIYPNAKHRFISGTAE